MYQIVFLALRERRGPEEVIVNSPMIDGRLVIELGFLGIHRLDASVIDAALSQHVVLCSPLTLFAVLAVVRRSVESFAFQQASDDVLRTMDSFDKEWRKFSDGLTALGRQLATVRGTCDQLTGPRLRALETPLAHIDSLRRERGLGNVDESSESTASGPNDDSAGQRIDRSAGSDHFAASGHELQD